MRSIQIPKITFKNIANDSKDSKERIEIVYNRIFEIAYKNLQAKKKLGCSKMS